MNRAALIGVSMGDGPTAVVRVPARAPCPCWQTVTRSVSGSAAAAWPLYTVRSTSGFIARSPSSSSILRGSVMTPCRHASRSKPGPRPRSTIHGSLRCTTSAPKAICSSSSWSAFPGPTLADELRRVGQLPHARVTTVLTDVLDGLGAAHTQGVLHRDIKPSNVLIDADGRAKLADFGIATTTGNDLTNTGLVIGTPSYLAPERVAGRRASVQSDLYAVGVVAYEALSGTRPFVGDSALALAHAIHEGHPRPLRELRADVPEGLADLVMRAMARAPATRPATAEEFARQLAAQGASRGSCGADASATTVPFVPIDDTVHAAPLACPTDVVQANPAPDRSWRRVVLVLAGLLAIVIVGVSLWSLTRHDDGTAGPNPSDPTTTQPALPDPLEQPFDRLAEVVQPMNRVTIGTVAVLVLLSACGSDEPSITADGATTLGAQVADTRAVASAGDYVQAAGLLDEIDATVGDLLDRGDLSEQRAGDVTAAVDEVRGALAAFMATTTTVATTTVPPTTTVRPGPSPIETRIATAARAMTRGTRTRTATTVATATTTDSADYTAITRLQAAYGDVGDPTGLGRADSDVPARLPGSARSAAGHVIERIGRRRSAR